MKVKLARLSLLTCLVGMAFYSLHGENELPDLVLQSIHLLKKPVEELLPDLQEDSTWEASNSRR